MAWKQLLCLTNIWSIAPVKRQQQTHVTCDPFAATKVNIDDRWKVLFYEPIHFDKALKNLLH